MAPEGDWNTWLLLAGRGFGKTRVFAEDAWWYAVLNPGHRIAVVAPTQADLRKTCFLGESGLRAVVPAEVLRGGGWDSAYNSSLHELHFANGSLIQGFSAEKPGRLRGPQFHRAYCDELAAWQRLQETWDMLMFGLRLGEMPQCVITTTPKPLPLLHELMADPGCRKVSGSTYENKANLSPKFLKKILAYEGTALGRQEIHAELVDLYADAILRPEWWLPYTKPLPKADFVLLSLDTAYTEEDRNDPSACTVWWVFQDDDGRSAMLLRYAWQKWLAFPDLVDEIEETWRHFRPGGVAGRIVIEAKASGISVVQELRRRVEDIPVWAEPVRGDKVARAFACQPVLHHGRVYVRADLDEDGEPALKAWGDMVVKECGSFPPAAGQGHDDLVDTVTQGIQHLLKLGIQLLPEDDAPPPAMDSRGLVRGIGGKGLYGRVAKRKTR